MTVPENIEINLQDEASKAKKRFQDEVSKNIKSISSKIDNTSYTTPHKIEEVLNKLHQAEAKLDKNNS